MRHSKASSPSTAYSGRSQLSRTERSLSESGHFSTARLAKISLNSQQQVNSAKLFVNEDKLILKNLSALEPLSHLVEEDKIVELLAGGKGYTNMTHLPVLKQNINSENFEIQRGKQQRKETNSKLLQNVYGGEAYKIKKVEHTNEKKIRKKVMKQFANMRGKAYKEAL